MNNCIIIGSAKVDASMSRYIKDDDFIIAADAGYLNAKKLGAAPNLFVGDYDTVKPPENELNVIKLPCEKDDTDIMFAARKAVELGFKSVIIIGGMGGRLDHTIANMQVLVFLQKNNINAMLCDEINEVTVMLEKEIELMPRTGWYVSVFPIKEKVTGVTLEQLKYPLTNATLTNSFPIGISNEYMGKKAKIKCDGNGLFIIHSRMD